MCECVRVEGGGEGCSDIHVSIRNKSKATPNFYEYRVQIPRQHIGFRIPISITAREFFTYVGIYFGNMSISS